MHESNNYTDRIYDKMFKTLIHIIVLRVFQNLLYV